MPDKTITPKVGRWYEFVSVTFPESLGILKCEWKHGTDNLYAFMRGHVWVDENGEGIDACRFLRILREVPAPVVVWEWRDAVGDPPKTGVPVLAYFLNPLGKGRTVRATLYGENELPDAEDGDDEGFAPAGWYETNDGEETIFAIDGSITDWMPLPHPPALTRSLESKGQE